MRQKFIIEGMSCSACSASVERVTNALEGVESASVNLISKFMLCSYDETKLNADDIISAVQKAGFEAFLVSDKSTGKQYAPVASEKKGPREKTRLVVSVAFLIPLMYISMGHMLSLPLPGIFHGEENALIYAFTQFLLALPVAAINFKFYTVGFSALCRRAPNMDTLVAVGSLASYIYGIIAIYLIGYGLGHGDPALVEHYTHDIYFESGAMILTLVTLGKMLEERAKRKTNSAVKKLTDLAPKKATVIRNGVEVIIPADEIVLHDILPIKPGMMIPVDGIVQKGSGTVDESALTGESMPVMKQVGSGVLSASVNLNGYIEVEATRVGEDTTLARITEIVMNAGASKAPAAKLADKISGIFVPTVMSMAALTTVIWLVLDYGLEFALTAGVSVLVISCPCALGLATPVAITAALGKCASHGILIKSAQALEAMATADTVVFDKTGTITEGKPRVMSVRAYGCEETYLIKAAADAESKSEHPLAFAILEYAKERCIKADAPEEFEEIAGKGVRIRRKEGYLVSGKREFLEELGITLSKADEYSVADSDEATKVYIAENGRLIGVIEAGDKLRSNAVDAIAELKVMGIKTVLLTGDRRVPAEAVAQKLGVDMLEAEVMPEQKRELILKLRDEGRKCVMVGDGINDSPALAEAEVGIAMSGGRDIAIEAADIVLVKNELSDIVFTLKSAKNTLRNIKQNLFWAFFYNVICIPIAARVLYPAFGILLSPMIAAAAMSFSSLLVVTNGLRAGKV